MTLTKAVIVAGMALYGVYYLRQNPKPLTEQFPRAATLSGQGDVQFFPLSKREILALTRPVGRQEMKAIDGMFVFTLHAYRIDLKSGKVTRDTRLEKAVTEWPWHGFALSPDRQSLLCMPCDWKHPGQIIDLASLHRQPVALPPRSLAVWFPDSRSVATIHYPAQGSSKRELVRFGRADADHTASYPVRIPSDFPQTPLFEQPAIIRPDGTLVLFASYQWAQDHPWRERMEWQELKQEGKAWVAQPMRFFEPPNMMIFSDAVRFSPDGSRILWHGLKQTSMQRKTWMLYTSKPDGSDMRRIGVVPGPTETGNDPELPPLAIGEKEENRPVPPSYAAEWMPDGKTICFYWSGGFYLVEDR